MLAIQLSRLQSTGFADKLTAAAQAHGLDPAFLFAIASRETNCVNELGDFRNGEYHGVGIIQIDIQHDIAREARDSGSWRTNPDPLIDFGAGILQANLAQADESLAPEIKLKLAASAYNEGMKNALAGLAHGDSDQRTTGHDYGRDVMARMAIFADLMGGASNAV